MGKRDILTIYMQAVAKHLKAVEQEMVAAASARLATEMAEHGDTDAAIHADIAKKAFERCFDITSELEDVIAEGNALSEHEGLGYSDRGKFLALRNCLNSLDAPARQSRHNAKWAFSAVRHLATP